MNWVSDYHYAVILQEERLRRAQEPGWVLSWLPVRTWLSALKGRVAAWVGAHGQTVAWRSHKGQDPGLARSHD